MNIASVSTFVHLNATNDDKTRQLVATNSSLNHHSISTIWMGFLNIAFRQSFPSVTINLCKNLPALYCTCPVTSSTLMFVSHVHFTNWAVDSNTLLYGSLKYCLTMIVTVLDCLSWDSAEVHGLVFGQWWVVRKVVLFKVSNVVEGFKFRCSHYP